MKITKQVLKKMIKEELGALSESTRPSAGGAPGAHYATDNKEEKIAPARVGSQEKEQKSVTDGDRVDDLRDSNKALKRALAMIDKRPELARTLKDLFGDMPNAKEEDIIFTVKQFLRDLLKT